ncbi:heavy metal sensor histidine kinase [Undibacterium terreum]|uniref:Sensor protein n=1 Tax=Undibacterium terreum TaxID=1224302 RepID=A0A916U9Y5_9BURK|nr:heavy metal sensor histidine kinase [Undibacterium terreum]GGC64557.1 two-component sensor histidine kinase [Undibacterium terreum]
MSELAGSAAADAVRGVSRAGSVSRHSLIWRLVLLFAAVAFAVLASAGYLLYGALEKQLMLRDDAALINRVEQIRALLRDEDLLDMIQKKPELFGNMLGNHEALLVLKYPGQAPLLEVNPGKITVPDMGPMPIGATLSLAAVQHTMEKGTPFITLSASAHTEDAPHELQIITGRLLTERTRMLAGYRDQIIAVSLAAAILIALLAYWIVRRGLLPLRRLADQTASIGIRNLSVRIASKNTPRELAPLIDAFNTMLDRLETSFAQLSQVSADMAHDLRTPIGNLLGQTEVALGQKRDVAYYEKLLGSNFEELQRLSKMTDNMLFLARAEHADNAIECATLDVAEELERQCEYFEGLAEERGIWIVCKGEGKVWADANLLRRAVANLLSNAVRYADEGTEITLAVEQSAAGTLMVVKNAGPTIEAHHLSRLFDRFYRADPSRRGSDEASGLGLSIVRSIMLLHQGKWEAASSNGVTRFSLFFPAKPAA